MSPLSVLLSSIVDYAGLFPPAQLDMTTAARNYAAYRKSDHAWALGRFILPVSRLDEFEHAVRTLLHEDEDPWLLSALPGADLESDTKYMLAFNAQHRGNVMIDTVEVKASNPEEIKTAARIIQDGFTLYFEVPIDSDPRNLLETITQVGGRAKVRTGGVTEDAFPTSRDLARFLVICAELGLPFKATAGLHHPIRSVYRLTYKPGGPSGMMFGFLNVFLAAAFVRQGMDEETAVAVLEETSPKAFLFKNNSVRWHTYLLSNEELLTARHSFARSFGSCSFEEPIQDLQAINLL